MERQNGLRASVVNREQVADAVVISKSAATTRTGRAVPRWIIAAAGPSAAVGVSNAVGIRAERTGVSPGRSLLHLIRTRAITTLF